MKHRYLLICTNQKLKGKCCGQIYSDEFYNCVREELNSLKIQNKLPTPVKIVKTSCLGKCAYGPNLIIYPDEVWYSYRNIEDIKEIVSSHIVEGKIVSRLLVKES